MNIFDDLQFRELVADFTAVPESRADLLPIGDRLAAKPITLYCGFDPTADSLHVGSLVPLIALRRFQNAGHHPIAVAGGATGSIGDPSGKTQERQLLTSEQIKVNVEAVRPQLAKLLDFDSKQNPARLVDNADWFGPITLLDFLRDVGKHFTVNQMVAKESVRARMEDREVGISYTEFSYMMLQAYDYYHLARDYGCELQIGGSDQWGNITAGIDLIRKKLGQHSYGLTLPLITKADGTKFGKTERGTIWLDANKTSVYKFYQFWINTDDRDVVKYLKYFTFLSAEEITALDTALAANPGARQAHQALAREVTTLIHGEAATKAAMDCSDILFGGNLYPEYLSELISNFKTHANRAQGRSDILSGEPPDGTARAMFAMLREEVPGATISIPMTGLPLIDALVSTTLATSKGQARRDVEGGGVSVNFCKVKDVSQVLTIADTLLGKYILLRKGKKQYALLTVA